MGVESGRLRKVMRQIVKDELLISRRTAPGFGSSGDSRLEC